MEKKLCNFTILDLYSHSKYYFKIHVPNENTFLKMLFKFLLLDPELERNEL